MTSSNFRKHYINVDFTSKLILNEFTKSLLTNNFYLNLSYLIDNSDIIEFNKDRWTYNPNVFSFDHYDYQYFYPIILLTNSIPSIFDFKRDNLSNGILTPSTKSINKILTFINS